jgi:glucose-6-phosphate isomerase
MGQQGADPHRRHAGSRPQSVLVLDELTPAVLGALIALYEHKVYVQSVIWGINAFDQFGVEAGKRVCNEMLATSTPGAPGATGARAAIDRDAKLRSVRQLLKSLDA